MVGRWATAAGPNDLSVDRVEGFCQVYEDGGAAVWAECTLGFRQVFLRDVGDAAVEDDPSQALPRDGQEGDASVVAAVSLTILVLEQGDEHGIP